MTWLIQSLTLVPTTTSGNPFTDSCSITCHQKSDWRKTVHIVRIQETVSSNLFEGKLCRLRLPIHVSKHPLNKKSLRHSLNNCLLNIFLWFLSHFDDGGTDGEPLASLELCCKGEETTVLYIQVVVHLGRGKLKTPSGQRRRI